MANNKLYPPQIEGVIPSFFEDTITVPYSMNRAVSDKEVKGYTLKIKTVQSNYFLGELEIQCGQAIASPLRFVLTDELKKKINIGESYKLQLAYKNEDGIAGYYSTVGVVKYTAKPEVFIDNLSIYSASGHHYNYIGVYQNKDDITEKIYSYNFKVFDLDNNVIANSGELLHNSSLDSEIYESRDEFLFSRDIERGVSYYIQYTVTTINGLQISSPRYKIKQKDTIMSELKANLVAELNYDNGYVDLKLQSDSLSLYTGAFCITRAKVSDIYNWEEIYRFYISNKEANINLFKDFTVEQGETYIYSIQQYNANDLFSERILSNKIYVDFEDAFLFDGKRQLRLRYNPKISSFKTTLLETKTDTLGSKYPFIFRNGSVEYKEFPVSGLISYWMDEEDLFTNKGFATEEQYKKHTPDFGEELKFKEQFTKNFNLTGENLYHERQFKIEVLDWLNNGKIKLFRSPGEGNYLVRLMNVSLSPNDTVGRMLHTFNATAYEVAKYSYENLYKNNMITVDEPTDDIDYWKTIDLKNIKDNEKVYINNITSLNITDAKPGSCFYINNEKIIIGATGHYSVNGKLNIEFIPSELPLGYLTYQYKDKAKIQFSLISKIEGLDYPLRQFIGRHDNVLSLIEDSRSNVLNYNRLYFRLRPVFNISNINEIVDEYAIYNLKGTYYDGYLATVDQNNQIIKEEDYDTTFSLNGSVVDLQDSQVFEIYDIDSINQLSIGSGVILDISYQSRVITYDLEENNEKILEAKNEYLQAKEEYDNKLWRSNNIENWDSERIHSEIIKLDNLYRKYISILEAELKAYKEEWGIS